MDLSKAISIRYIVNDVEKAISFYKEFLDFEVKLHPAPGFAALTRGNLQLFLNQPGAGGAGQALYDGQSPESGGWNRIQISVVNLASLYSELKKKGAKFKNGIIKGKGGKQALLEDPSGNLIELFEPKQQKSVNPVPQGFHTVTPFLLADDATKLIEFIKKAFDGQITYTILKGLHRCFPEAIFVGMGALFVVILHPLIQISGAALRWCDRSSCGKQCYKNSC